MEPQQNQVQSIVQNQTEVVNPGHSFSWEASEFVHHEKPALWYVGLWVGAAVLCGVLAFLQQWFGVVVVVMMTLAVIVYSRKEPRTLSYAIDDNGISIDGKLSTYKLFHSYSVHPEVGWHEIDLEPARRFSPRLTLLAEGESFDQIEAILSQHLPRQDRELDPIEKLSRYLKF